MSFYAKYGKRWFDIVIAAVGLFVSSPLLIALAVAVRCNLGSPVLFCQRRPGLQGNLFWMYKFRSMTDGVDSKGNQIPDADRLTPFGRWLRSVSLDELPELWNVLRGDMSLVGPRPLLPEYLPHYTHEQARRHEVKPGLTGWAQVQGRNKTFWDERLKLDLWYVRNHSFWLDLKILAMTVVAVLSRRGISADSHATMPRFDAQPVDDIHHEQAA